MATPKALVLRSAGTNCDRESEHALKLAGFSASRVHLFRVMEAPSLLEEVQLLMFPGGFSYGDDVGAGKIFANQMIHHLAEPLNRFVEGGKLVLGVCNGFQVLIKSGLLPWGRVEAARAGVDATLAWNDSGLFIDRWIRLRVDSDRCAFLAKGQEIELPIAHGEGKFIPARRSVLTRLRDQDQVALRYVGDNPNGSVDDVAGITDPSGRVLGLMPHPERFVEVTQHPAWTRGAVKQADGLGVFRRAFAYFA